MQQRMLFRKKVNNPDECEIITGVFMDEELGDELIVATVATGMNDQTDDGIVEIETTSDHSEDFHDDIQTVELEVRKVDQDYPVNADDYPDLIDEDLDEQSENSVKNR